MLTLLLILSPGLAAEVDAALLSGLLERYNAGAVFPLPPVAERELEALLAGEVSRWVDQPAGEDGPRRAGALYLAKASREAMWLSCQDPHFAADPAVQELRLSHTPPDEGEWYGIIDLPAPFADRHWFVRSWNNHALVLATGGEAWEHPWQEIPGDVEVIKAKASQGALGSVRPEDVERAVLTPSNRGAFFAMTVPDGRTLFGYHTVFQAGGSIPDWAVLKYASAGLERAMRRYEARAQGFDGEHFDAAHPPVAGGDGRPVSFGAMAP